MDIFSIMPIEAFMDDRLSKTELRVLGAIVSYMNKDTKACWPKRDQIANRCNLPLCKISTATTHLVDLGWLIKVGDGGRSKSTEYRLTIPNLDIKTVTDSVTITECETVTDLVTVTKCETVTDSVTKTVTDSVTKTVTDSVRGIKQTNELTNEQTNTQIKNNRKKSSPIDNGFDEFWKIYPKKKSKEDAQKAWLKISPDEQLQKTIIDAVILAKTQDIGWIKDNGQFIPYPASYLNGKRWEDEIEQARPAPKHNGFMPQPAKSMRIL